MQLSVDVKQFSVLMHPRHFISQVMPFLGNNCFCNFAYNVRRIFDIHKIRPGLSFVIVVVQFSVQKLDSSISWINLESAIQPLSDLSLAPISKETTPSKYRVSLGKLSTFIRKSRTARAKMSLS